MGNNKQSSSVEWLFEKIKSNIDFEDGSISMNWLHDDTLEQAKAIHKEEKTQLIKDYFDWHKAMGFVSHKPEDIEEFINEKFGGNK